MEENSSKFAALCWLAERRCGAAGASEEVTGLRRVKVHSSPEGAQVWRRGARSGCSRLDLGAPPRGDFRTWSGAGRPAGPPLGPSNSPLFAQPEFRSQRSPAAPRRASARRADCEPEARRRTGAATTGVAAELGAPPWPRPAGGLGRRAPARPDGQTDRRGPPGSPSPPAAGAGRAGTPDICSAGGGRGAEPASGAGTPAGTCSCPSSPRTPETSPCDPATFPIICCPAPPWPRSRVHNPADLHLQATWSPAGRAFRRAHPPVPRARRRWSPKDPPVARAAGSRDRVWVPRKAAGRVSRIHSWAPGGDDEAGERGAAERQFRGGAALGRFSFRKPFLLFLEKRRRRFRTAVSVSLAACSAFFPVTLPPLCPAAVQGAPRQLLG